MIRTTSLILAILLSMSVARIGAAQWNTARFDTEQHSVYTTFGLDPAWVSTFGYARVIPLLGRDVQFSGDAGVVAARLDLHDFRVRLGMQALLLRWRSLGFTGSATFITRGTENSIYRGFNFGADFTGALGVYRPGWFAGGEFGFDKAIITHVTHSNWYRTYFYSDARDGWYLDAGGTYHYGLVGGVAVGWAELVGRFGFRRTEDFNDLIPPLYVSLGLGYAF